MLVGAVFGGLTLLFLMLLVLFALQDKEVPCNSRLLIVFVLALGAALAAAFLGGDVTARGTVPLPFGSNKPIQFSAAGGVAVLIIVILIGNTVYANQGCKGTGKACHSEIAALTSTLSERDLASAGDQYQAAKVCVSGLQKLESRQSAAHALLKAVFSDVGTHPVPRRLRTLRANVLALVREVQVTNLADLLRQRPLDELDLFRVNLSGTNLRHVSFRGAFLIETNFEGANLDGADFSSAYVRNVNFKNASLNNTIFDGADWFNALNLTHGQLLRANRNGLAHCPSDRDGFFQELANRYTIPFDAWNQEIKDELLQTWESYLESDGLCSARSGWQHAGQ